MHNEEKYIELRVAYPGHPYVDVLGPWCPRRGFTRIRNRFHDRRERFPDGRQEQVHMLPDASLTYEVHEMRNGKPTTWYAATVQGDSNIHHISRLGAEMVARDEMPILEAVREYPEMPPIELDEE